ncbi:MAG: hypothetical protein WAJ91_15000 [Rhodoplanes sp.]|jgi:hypothetical protein
MKTAAMLTFAAAIIAAAPAKAWDGAGYAAPPSASIMRAELGSNGLAGSFGSRTYGIRCNLTAGPHASEQRRPLRWLLNRCRPWAA